MTLPPPVLPQRFPYEALVQFRRDPIATLRRAARECGDVVRLPISRHPVFLLNHPDLIKDVLVTHQRQFQKSKGLERMKKLLGEGLLTSEGEFHLRQRRRMQPAFHRQRIAGLRRGDDPLCTPDTRTLAGGGDAGHCGRNDAADAGDCWENAV